MRIAFAGFRHGHIWSLYKMAMKNDSVIAGGYYEEDEATRNKIKEQYGIENTHESYQALLEDEQIDAIAIGDYYGKRGQMIIAALRAGKHVICDKPICTKVEELDEIMRLAEEMQLQVRCMLELRYMPQVEKVKELIQNDVIGKIRIASFTGQHCLDYGVRPQWYFEEGKHGGTINDIAIHGIDLVRYLTSKNLTNVNYAKVWNAFAQEEPKFKDCGQFMVEMEDMALMADVSFAAPKCKDMLPTYWEFCFWGTKGMVKFNLKHPQIYLYRDTEEVITCPVTKAEYLDDFICAVTERKGNLVTTDILESQRQTLLVQAVADKQA